MSSIKGYYSLIQFCPDSGRLEFANVGVLLHCPEIGFIDTKLSRENDRVRHFFGGEYPGLDYARLTAAKQAIENRIRGEKEYFRSIEDLTNFINSRANELRLSPLRPVKVFHPEETLSSLFNELISERKEHIQHIPLFPELNSTFQELHNRIRDRVYLNTKIDVPTFGKLEVNYGFHNGSLNWVRTQKFDDKTRINDVASRLAMQGRFIEKEPTKQGDIQKLIVVSFIPSESISDIQPKIKEIFDEVDQRLVTQDEVHTFVEEVQQQAH